MQYYLKEAVRWFWLPILFFALLAAIPVLASNQVIPPEFEGRYWRFETKTEQSLSTSSDALEGKSEVIVSSGKLHAFLLINGEKVPAGPESAAELKRMTAFGQDERQYLKPALSIGAKWTTNYSYYIRGRSQQFWRSVDYEVKASEELTTAVGRLKVFKIEGSSSVQFRDGTFAPVSWIYYYSPDTHSIVEFRYDSAVGREGVKIEIRLIKTGASSPQTQ